MFGHLRDGLMNAYNVLEVMLEYGVKRFTVTTGIEKALRRAYLVMAAPRLMCAIRLRCFNSASALTDCSEDDDPETLF